MIMFLIKLDVKEINMIKILTGSMFSGKSGGLARIYETMWNKKIIKCFKPKTDTRDGDKIQARYSNHTIYAMQINDLSEILVNISEETKVIFIDEAQFLIGDVSVIKKLSMINNIDFYISGLNMTSELKPFGIMPELMAIADEIDYYHASCYYCNKRADYTMFVGNKDSDIFIGNDEYRPVCSDCYVKNKFK